MAARATLLLLCALACRPQAVAQAPALSCLDRELRKRGLNQFGDPPDTMYTGGTPLFDEATGKRRDRQQYVFEKHPDIAKACDGG